MNKPITPKEMEDWVGGTWDRCQKQAWSEPMKDWVMELCPEIAEWQAEIIVEQVRIRVESEREACAKLCEAEAEKWEGDDGPISTEARLCAINIRARREK